jgi:hypothetical protein
MHQLGSSFTAWPAAGVLELVDTVVLATVMAFAFMCQYLLPSC